MTTLICLIVFVAIWGLLVYNSNTKKRVKNSLFLIGSFISMWYVHSMVDPNSILDLPTYQEAFTSIRRTPWKALPNHWAHETGGINMEMGYLYFNKIIGLITSNFTFFLWIFSFVMLYAYFKTIRKYSPYVFLSVLILLLMPYGQSLFVIRQHMAMALLFSSIPLIIERKLIPFLLVIGVIFYSVHHSCLVFLPVYFIYGFKGKRLIWALIISMGIIASFWSIITLISIYLDYEAFTMESSSEHANVSTFIQMLLFLVLYIFALGKDLVQDGINKLCFCILAISVFLNGMSLGLNLGRLAMYYNVIAILSVPLSLKYIHNAQLRYVLGLSIVLLLLIQALYGSNSQYYEDMQLLSLF